MANIVLKDVNKIYPNNVHAVFDFNIEIKDKEFIVFVGPSGCGKSTTLRMIAGLEEITSGEFSIDGKLMNFIPPKDRNVSMVFQNYALYPHMTVYKNIAYGLTIRKTWLPTYESNPELTELLKEIKNVKKKLNAVLKKIAKDGDNQEFKAEFESLSKEFDEKLAKAMSLRKPVVGIDEARIKRLHKEIEKYEHEINYVNGLIETEEKEQTNDEELLDMYKKDVLNYTELKKEKMNELSEIEGKETEILKYRHMYLYEIDNEVYHAADILGLKPYLSRFPSELSGGQRQRVALGRAIVRKPKVFLMDEPLSNLDAKLRVQTRGEILKLHKRVGATTIYVTHDQTEAMTLADRIVIMKDGYIQQIAKPMDAFNDPANIFVAGFIGSPAMNFLHGKVQKGEFVTLDGTIALKLKKEQIELLKDYADEEIVLGIRPENISINGGAKDPVLEIDTTELLGDEFVIYTKTGEQNISIKSSDPKAMSLEGKTSFAFNADSFYFFDSTTTLRIK